MVADKAGLDTITENPFDVEKVTCFLLLVIFLKTSRGVNVHPDRGPCHEIVPLVVVMIRLIISLCVWQAESFSTLEENQANGRATGNAMCRFTFRPSPVPNLAD